MDSRVILEARQVKRYFPLTQGIIAVKVRGWVKAVDRVDLELREGETLGLVGESGSGKSTLSRLFLMLQKPTGGSLYFEGKDFSAFTRDDYVKYRRHVQAVFQDPLASLNPRMRAGSIVAEPLPVGVPRREAREKVEQVLSNVGLPPDCGSLFPHEFSGGQRQRIAIARALVTHPKAIVLDEPVSALDVSIRAQVLNLLRDIQERLGMSYLLISHDLGTLRFITRRLAVLYAGKVVEMGPSADVYREPLHPYTQALLSAILPLHRTPGKNHQIVRGEPPSPVAFPPGCRFHPRCPYAMPRCSNEEPRLVQVSPDRSVACFLHSSESVAQEG